MSETFCIHDAEDNHIGNICRASGLRYQVRVRMTGERKMTLIGKPHRSKRAAARELADAMTGNIGWDRGDLLAIEPFPSYYEPFVVMEVRR